MEEPDRRRFWGVVTGQGVAREKLRAARNMRTAMTPTEKKFWKAVRKNGLVGLHFRRQQVIDGFMADFFCSEKRLVVELDGPVHDSQAEHDKLRDEVIERRGLRVLRIQNRDVEDRLEWVLARIVEM